MNDKSQTPDTIIIEPFYGGSHKQLVDLLSEELSRCVKFTLPAKKWHWRARTSALYFAQTIPHSDSYRVLFCSSVLNLCELASLRPDLGHLTTVVYFHENQLVYPVRKQQDRDFQYGYNQITSSLVADKVVFNSKFNMDSFLSNIQTFLKLIPDHRPKNIADQIRPKCSYLYFPIFFNNCRLESSLAVETGGDNGVDNVQNKEITPAMSGKSTKSHFLSCVHDVPCADQCKTSDKRNTCTGPILAAENHCSSATGLNNTVLCEEFDSTKPEAKKLCVENLDRHTESTPASVGNIFSPLHIVWPHRWEHDKNPEAFFQVLKTLHTEGLSFQVSVLGETFSDVPAIFEESRRELSSHIIHWGYLPAKSDYYRVLHQADVVVSTALHEFFGVAMLEAIYCDCYPLCPNRLVYPEILQNSDYLYNTDNQLLKMLRKFCKSPHYVRNKAIQVDVNRYSWDKLKLQFMNLLKQ